MTLAPKTNTNLFLVAGSVLLAVALLGSRCATHETDLLLVGTVERTLLELVALDDNALRWGTGPFVTVDALVTVPAEASVNVGM